MTQHLEKPKLHFTANGVPYIDAKEILSTKAGRDLILEMAQLGVHMNEAKKWSQTIQLANALKPEDYHFYNFEAGVDDDGGLIVKVSGAQYALPADAALRLADWLKKNFAEKV